jgi:hypothetical protein
MPSCCDHIICFLGAVCPNKTDKIVSQTFEALNIAIKQSMYFYISVRVRKVKAVF